MKQWIFKLFTRQIDVKTSKLKDDARILWLANRLLDELNTQGHDTNSSVKELVALQIFVHKGTDPETALQVANITKGWRIAGKRT